MNQQVFISYSNKSQTDRHVADTIYDTLKARGIPCWVAHRDIAAGQNWPDAISKAISNSRVMIVVLSEHTQKSHYVDREVTQAADENLTIIPFCIDEVSLSGGLKLLLSNCQWINAYPHLQDKDLDRLVETLQSYLGIEPGKTFKSVEKQPEVDIESSKSFRLKWVLLAVSIIIAVIAVVFFVSQWINNRPDDLDKKQKLAEHVQKKTLTKLVEDIQQKMVTKPIKEKDTAALPITNKKEQKEKIEVPIKEQPDFIRDLKSKGWGVKKIGNASWEAFYKNHDITMIYIPPGKFVMGVDEGYNSERPPHEVDLDGYWIGKYEVIFAQYDRFCEESGKKKPGDENWGRGKRPVINISWGDAGAYCDWLSQKTGLKFDLPSEAQWEKAARGPRGHVYPWGNDFDKDKCNSDESGMKRTMPVGTFPSGRSSFGCMDMAGNAQEWCSDWYDENYYKKSPAKNPRGPTDGSSRVIRGGSWVHNFKVCRAVSRHGRPPAGQSRVTGFRLMMII